ncbi:hypothetical protein JG687_00013490, partial [Phytophthora cactorum]
KWPRRERKNLILIQQDNAKSHIGPSDPDILAAGTADGWNIRQALQLRKPVYGIQSRIKAVEDAYEAMDGGTLDDIFLTLQKCMECILKESGGNEYKLPHMGKAKLRTEGKLPKSFSCDREIYTSALAILEKAGRPFSF